MLVIKPYNRENALAYARKYAFSQNSYFANLAGIGGNCTNFVSQSIYAGSCEMNYKPTFGWYFISLDDRSPSWTGVEYFYNFMVQGMMVSATVNIQLLGDGNRATVTIYPNFNNNNLTMTGTVVPYNQSNVFQGQTF